MNHKQPDLRKGIDELRADVVAAVATSSRLVRLTATAKLADPQKPGANELESWAQIISQIIQAVLAIIMAIDTTTTTG